MEDAIRELGESTRRLRESIEDLVSDRRPVTNASSVNVNAGGMGGWIAAWIAGVCCAAMLSAGIVFVLYTNSILAKQQDQISRMQDYLNAIYAAAPQLKPKE